MNATPYLPLIVPPQFEELEPAAGQIGPEPEDFLVEEMSAYEKSGKGEHLFLWVEKRGLNTTDVARSFEKVTDVKGRDIGFAGMKDKHAITRQWFSLLHKEGGAKSWDLREGIKILKETRHDNKLRTGHLHGNRFSLRLLAAPEQDAAETKRRATIIYERIQKEGLINAFGPQRFGRGLSNLDKAMHWLIKAGDTPINPKRKTRRGGLDPKLMQSVIQSDFFNRYAQKRTADKRPLIQGEVVRLNNTNTHFRVEDVEAELPRFLSGDLKLTGVLPGHKTLQSDSDAALLEAEVFEEMALSQELRERLIQSAPGARRDLFLELKDFSLEVTDVLTLHFSLPSGSYATTVSREFSHSAYDEPRAFTPRGPEIEVKAG